jgi:hypothetical protein
VADAKTNPDGVSKSTVYPSEMGELIGEQTGEQSMGGGESGARHLSINNPNGSDCPADERSICKDGTRGEQIKCPSQWLKSTLPEASSGFRDIRDKGNGMAIKFRSRAPDL